MGWTHPFFLALSVLGGLYVLWLGRQRFRSLHLGVRCPFSWKRHVRIGTLVLGLWVAGPLIGLAMAQLLWGMTFVTGIHAWVGVTMIPLSILGYASGLMLDKVKKRRMWLPLAHGINNLLLVILSLWQVWTGWGVIALL